MRLLSVQIYSLLGLMAAPHVLVSLTLKHGHKFSPAGSEHSRYVYFLTQAALGFRAFLVCSILFHLHWTGIFLGSQ